MNERHDVMYQAATQYYLHGNTMDSIAHSLGLSRSSVSRLLSQARREGLVRITIADALGTASPEARALRERFGIAAHLVNVSAASSASARLEQVARRAASLLADAVHADEFLGVAWGVTMASLARHLPQHPLSGVSVVQMNGGANPRTTDVPYVGEMMQRVATAFDARVTPFPVPAFFDHAETKRAMWRERSIQYVLGLQQRLDVAVFGVGSLTGSIPSHVYAAGYLDAEERAELAADGVVGDICTVLLREDGSYADIPTNARATGLTPAEMARIPRRICVVADPARSRAVLGALRAGVATDLVLDDHTAKAILRRA